MKTHSDLLNDAKKAIENLFSDASVPVEETREDLEELQAQIESMIDSI